MTPRRWLRQRFDLHIRALLSEPTIVGPRQRFHRDPSAVVNDAYVVLNSGDVVLEAGAFLGFQVGLFAGTHDAQKVGAERLAFPATGCDIHIAEGAWIGSRAILLGPVRVGRHAVVAAGSIVTRDVPDYAIAMGSPAKVVSWVHTRGDADEGA